MTGEAVVADSLEKRYGGVSALGGVSLAVPRGETFALVGPNGAGKTTLVRCLTGTTDPTRGSASVLGVPPRTADPSRVGLLPQDLSPPDRLTARELLAYYAGLYDKARPVDAVLSAVGMTESADVRYRNLSGGQRRRTLVGTAIVNEPDVLFLDEPTTGIDPAGRRAVWALVERLSAGGATVFLTSHDMAEVERLADRIGVVVGGELVAVGTPAELLDAHGGASRLLVETDEAGAAGDTLAGHPVTTTGRGLRVDGVERDDVGDVVDALAAAGVEYDALVWRQPDLEAVYLDLAGEAVAGGDPGTGGEPR